MNRTSIWLSRAAGITAAGSLALSGLVATAATAQADRPTCSIELSATSVGPFETLTVTVSTSDPDMHLSLVRHGVTPDREIDTVQVTSGAETFAYEDLRMIFGLGAAGGRYEAWPVYDRAERSSEITASPTMAEPMCSAAFTFKPKRTQTINFANPGDRLLGSGSFDAAATASSGMSVYVRTLTPEVCSVAGQLGRVHARGPRTETSVRVRRDSVPSIVSLLAAGTCTLEAHQYGSLNYAAATPVTRSFRVTTGTPPVPQQPGPQQPIPGLPTKGLVTQVVPVLGAGESARVAASPATVCRVAGRNVVLVGQGTCTITVRTTSGALKRRGTIAVRYGKGAQPAMGLEHVGAVYFAFNSAKLKPAAKATLRAKARTLRSATTVVAYGNTYGPGKNGASSRKLARARATAVVRYLSRLGVRAKTVTVASAMQNPVSKKPAKNRRVDLYVAK